MCSHGRVQCWYCGHFGIACDGCTPVIDMWDACELLFFCVVCFVFMGKVYMSVCGVCYTEKATPARHRPERQHDARSNRRKQCSPNETKPYSNPTPPHKRQNTPTNGHTPRRMKPTHARLTYTRMRRHAPCHQAGDHPEPLRAHTERHNPPKVRTQRQSGLPPRAASMWSVLHGESITDQASPRTPTQRTFQPQEAVQPQRNQTILQADTPAQQYVECQLMRMAYRF